jgi:hypothetical protein
MTTINLPVDLKKLSLDNLYKLLEIAYPGEQANAIREEIAERYALGRKRWTGCAADCPCHAKQ